MGDRRVNDYEPQRGEEHHRAEFQALNKRADDQPGCDDRERHLKHDENRFGEGPAVEFIDADSLEE